jgi:sugar O-acyltransferase (sialic acid O-acetyltransferase NeuD family)
MINLIGGGGHASVVADVARRCGHREITLWCEDAPDLARFPAGTRARPISELGADCPVILAFGDLPARADARRRWPAAAAPLVDPSAIIGSGVAIAPGAVVMPLCVVNANARVGVDAILNSACVVEHDCIIGANAHISPGARLAGSVHVGAGAHLGTGAIVLPGIAIGESAVVGAGAVVTRNVAPATTVVGIPARIHRT